MKLVIYLYKERINTFIDTNINLKKSSISCVKNERMQIVHFEIVTKFNQQIIYLSTKSWTSDFNISSRYRTSFNIGFKTFLWQQQWQGLARPSLSRSRGQKLPEDPLECLRISRHGSLPLLYFLSCCTFPTEYLEQWRQRLSE
ncbi:hypothetical protein MSG28_003943 [Choristoneura fumiferana]|uniref:Uncharacterized protein n=1 Tax=Choristoneura fumiferana TaxID=7141 RepID=A0ACC0KH47_CHOFU|nr:hypothetical protein MSG28_003943 [Choristoneura fumiferana]